MLRLKINPQTLLRGSFASLIKALTIVTALLSFNAASAQVCDGGTVSLTATGLTTETICVDGIADVLSFSHSTTATAPNYSYIITNDIGEIIGLPPAGAADFDPAGVGTCLVYGISYDGTLNAMAGTGMNISAVTATGCSDLSDNFLSIIRDAAAGGMVTTVAGTTTEAICIDGVMDAISFATSSSSALNYSYVVTNDAGDIIGLPPANTVEFDGAGVGTCYVYGVSYSGTLNAMAGTGMNISAVTATGCHEVSSNFVSVVREAADGGMVTTVAGTTTEIVCIDGVADVISFANSSTAGALNYSYVVTNDAGDIIGLPPANMVEFDGAGVGTCYVYGVSYTGTLNAMAGTGMNISAVTATGCSEISANFVSVVRDTPDGGMVRTLANQTSDTICVDGIPDAIDFKTTCSASDLLYSYIVTNDMGEIIGLPPGNTVEFDGAGVGTCYVYGISYVGTLNAMAGVGMNISAVTASGCYELSGNFVSIVREDCSLAMGTPEGLAAAPSSTSVNLYWTPVPGAINYRVCGRVAGTSMTFRCVGNPDNTKSISGLAPGQSYEWFVVANAGGGLHSDPSTHSVFTTATARTGSIEANDLTIFPVPATDQVQLTYANPQSNEVNVVLTDMVGREYDQRSLSTSNGDKLTIAFDVSELPTGLYFVLIKDGAHSISKRVQVVH